MQTCQSIVPDAVDALLRYLPLGQCIRPLAVQSVVCKRFTTALPLKKCLKFMILKSGSQEK